MKNPISPISLRSLDARGRAKFAVAAVVVLLLQLFPVVAVGADAPSGDYIVLLSTNADLQAKITKEARLGNSISDVYEGSANGFVAELDAADVRRLKADKDVLVVELDRVIRLDDDSTTSTTTSTTSTTTTTVPTSSTTSSTTSTTTPQSRHRAPLVQLVRRQHNCACPEWGRRFS